VRTTTVLALLIALIAPASAQTIVHFLSQAMGRRAVMVDGYLYRPAGGGRHPGVVFLHGCSGLLGKNGKPNSRAMQWERTLTKLGYVVLMVDSYTPRGVKNQCEPATFDERIFTARPFDAIGALKYLQAQPFVDPSRIALMGWSDGGGAVLSNVSDDALRSNNGFKAAVAFYPARCNSMFIGQEWNTNIPLLVVLGGHDNWTPPAPCINAMKGVPYVDVKLYPTAGHDFDWPNDPIHKLPLYQTSAGVVPVVGTDPAARADALRLVPQFLQRNIGN